MKILLLCLFIILVISVIVILIVKCFKNKSKFNSNNSILEPIPKVIHKVIIEHSGNLPKFPLVPKELQEAHDSWKKMNPEYEIKYYSINDCREYLKKNFEDSDFLQAFDCLNAYADKCVFIRYIILYNEGGWYSDWKQVCLKKNLLNELDKNKKNNIIISWDRGNKDGCSNNWIQNCFIGSNKNNLFLKECINEIINNIKYKHYGKNSLDITSCSLLGKMYKKHYYKIKINLIFKNNHIFIQNDKIIKHKCDNCGYGQDWPKGNNYNTIWDYKKIYNDFKIKEQIPKIIYKTGPEKYKNLSRELLQIFNDIQNNNPAFKIKYYDNDDCYNLIKKNFGEEVLWAYNMLIPTAYKADLFRYCVLYLYGGIYSDLSQNIFEKLDNIIDFHKDTLILTEDFIHQGYSYPGIQISFIACIPKLKIFKLCIDNIINNSKNFYYGNTPLDITGPYLFKHNLNNNSINYIIKLYQSYGFLINSEGKKIIKTKSINHHNILYNKNNKHYYWLWKTKKIYNCEDKFIDKKYGIIEKIKNPFILNSKILWATDKNNNFIKNNWPNTFDFDFHIKKDIVENIKKLPKNHCIIDCGGHIGDLSIPICDATIKLNRTDILIYCIDPTYEKCEYVKYISHINNYHNLKVLHCGLYNTNQKLCNSGNVTDNNSGGTHWDNSKKTTDCTHFYSIDYLLSNNIISQKIGILHLDVEGHEFQVLQGIKDFESINYISCELHTDHDSQIKTKDKITKFLLSKNYKNSKRLNPNEIFIK